MSEHRVVQRNQKMVSRTYPGPEPMVLVLLVSGDVVVWVASVPAELVLLDGWHVDVLEVAVLRFVVGGSWVLVTLR